MIKSLIKLMFIITITVSCTAWVMFRYLKPVSQQPQKISAVQVQSPAQPQEDKAPETQDTGSEPGLVEEAIDNLLSNINTEAEEPNPCQSENDSGTISADQDEKPELYFDSEMLEQDMNTVMTSLERFNNFLLKEIDALKEREDG